MNERKRRWALALGSTDELLSDADRRMTLALDALYDDDQPKSPGLGASAPRVARWLGDIRAFFPAPVVQVIQKDAFDRKGLRQMLLQPEFLATVEPDVHLVADLISLRKVASAPSISARSSRVSAMALPAVSGSPLVSRRVNTILPCSRIRTKLCASAKALSST